MTDGRCCPSSDLSTGSRVGLSALVATSLIGVGLGDDPAASVARAEALLVDPGRCRPAGAFQAAYDSDPAIARHMVTMLAARLRTVTDGLADLAYLDLGARLAKYLINETARQQQSTLTLPLTQAEL